MSTALSCLPMPIALPIGNVTVANGGISRGIKMAVGTPPQELSFMPQLVVNNSYVYDTDSTCNEISQAFCETRHGGFYTKGQSSTLSGTAGASLSDVGGAVEDPSVFPGSQLWIKDSFEVDDNATMNAFPLGIVRKDLVAPYEDQAMIGLGRNSTFLNSLKSAGSIASRSWSFFWGLNGQTPGTQSDGTFVIGGYDAAKISGNNFTKAISNYKQCPSGMVVSLTDIRIAFPNGTSFTLFEKSRSVALQACISPVFANAFTLPIPQWQIFQSICQCGSNARGYGINVYDMLLDPNQSGFYGDIELEVESLLKITIPNSQLVGNQVTIAKDGSLVTNATTNELNINVIQGINANDMLMLGKQFFSAAMLMVNQDTNSFTLWEAAANQRQSLVAVGPSGVGMTSSCDTVVNTNSSTITNTTSAAPPAAQTVQATPAVSPALIGAIAGGAAALLALFVVIFLWYRRRKSKAIVEKQQADAPPSYSRHSDAEHADHASQMYGQQLEGQQVYEIGSKPTYAYVHEVDSRTAVAEMPARYDSTHRHASKTRTQSTPRVYEMG